MEVEAAARRLLIADQTVNGYVNGKVFRYRLEEKIEGTSGRAIVVARNNGWATPDPVTTQEFPILTVKCYADPSRDSEGNIRSTDAEDGAFALWRAVDKLLHGKRDEYWGGPSNGLRVVTSQRWQEPVLITERDRHGQTAGDPLGDTVYVHGQYALQVIH